MKYTADTWFLLELYKRTEKALKIFRDTVEGKSRIMIPTVSILELVRVLIMRGDKLEKIESTLGELKATQKIQLIVLDEEIAKEAAKVSVTHNLSSVDAIIAATYKISGCNRLLSNDQDLKKLDRRYLKIECW